MRAVAAFALLLACVTALGTGPGGQSSVRVPEVAVASQVVPFHDLYGGPGAMLAAACAGPTCLLAGMEGQGELTTNAGASFSSVSVAPHGSVVEGLACPSQSVCYEVGQLAGGGAFEATSSAGPSSFGPPSQLPATSLSGIACLGATSCVAVGYGPSGGVAFYTTNGSTFSQASLPSGVKTLNAVACTSGACLGVGQLSNGSGVVLSTSNLSSWTVAATPASTSLVSVACVASSTTCLVGGYLGASAVVYRTSDLASFASSSVPPGPVAVNGIACPSSSLCVAVDASGSVLVSSDAGATFARDPAAPSVVAGYLAVACSGASSCLLSGVSYSGVGFAVDATYGQSSPGTYALVALPGESSALSISCPSSSSCVAVGDSPSFPVAWVVSSAGAGVVQVPVAAVAGDLFGVSCPQLSRCVAVGQAGGSGVAYVSGDGGHTWSPSTLPSLTPPLTSVSCPTSSFCMAVDSQGDAYASGNGGGSFSPAGVPLPAGGLYAVACVSASTCVAAGYQVTGGSGKQGAVVYTTNGGQSWGLAANAAATQFYAVSCAGSSPVTCYVGGVASNSTATLYQLTLGSSGPSFVQEGLPASLTGIEGISCVSSTTCQAVDASGQVLGTSDGTTWVLENGPFTSIGLSGISCASYTQCFAVGGSSLFGTQAIVSGVSPSSGPVAGGNTVTIYGAGLLNTTAVYFGAAPAPSFQVASDFAVTAVVPAASSPGEVGVSLAIQGVGSSVPTASNGYVYTSAGPYSPLSPTRICDTRVGATDPPSYAGQTLPPGGQLDVGVVNANGDGVPPSATAVVAVITAVHPTSTGYLTVWPTGVARPLASSVNFLAGQTAVANLVEIPLGANGSISIFNAAGSTDVLVDVEGYVSGGSQYLFTPIAPIRLADTRPGSGYQDASMTLAPSSSITVQVAGAAGVPQNATAAVLNVTATNTTANGGYLVVYPAGGPLPTASSLNFDRGQTVAVRQVVPLGAGGAITITAFNSSADVVVDLNGWFASGSGQMFTPVAPVRIVDTRNYPGNPFQLAGQAFVPGVPKTFAVAGSVADGVPSGALAFVGNATVVDTAANGGYLTIYPAGSSVPPSSDLNWFAGQIVSNMLVVRLGSGQATGLAQVSATDVVVDVSGYYS
jgi:photosystem II stability/assembly factor-like uncharacterized protein